MPSFQQTTNTPGPLTADMNALLASITPGNITGRDFQFGFLQGITMAGGYTMAPRGSGLDVDLSGPTPVFSGTLTQILFRPPGSSDAVWTLDINPGITLAAFFADPLALFDGDDYISGFFGASVLYGYGGNDVLDGGFAGPVPPLQDTLYGGDGNDTFNVTEVGNQAEFNPVIFGGTGTDTISINWLNVGAAAVVDMGRLTTTPDSIEKLSFNYFDFVNGAFVFLDATISATPGSGLLTLPGLAAIEGVRELRQQAGGTINLGGIDFSTTNGRFHYIGQAGDNLFVAPRSYSANTTDIAYFGYGGNDTLGGAATAIESLFGGADNDTYVVGAGDVVVELTDQGTDTVQSGVSVNLGLIANVENVTLTGTAAVDATGNAGTNVIIGNAGANVLAGGGGTDTLQGLGGNDTYDLATGTTMIEAANGGTDTVRSFATATLAVNFENLVLMGAAAINGTGNGVANRLTGNAAVNTLTGGMGDDVYAVGAGDVVVEAFAAGTDTVESSVTTTLALNVENLVLGGTAAINGTGNAGNNVLTGNVAVNRLTGGAGDDTYVVGAGDVVVEAASGGTDTIETFLTTTLGANVENLELVGTAAVNGTGNALNNLLTGNSAINTLTGGAGNDTYVVGAGDIVVETASGGDEDVLLSSVTITLGTHVEALLLTGTAAINGTGNTADNSLVGNAAANRLNGLTGADFMLGGRGNDTYFVDDTGDVVFEQAGDAADVLRTSVNFTLATGVSIETLAAAAGLTSVDLTGNAIAQTITGNGGANVINGLSGADTLTGGSGADTFVFSAALAATGTDDITDFSRAMDVIHLQNSVFTTLGVAGALTAAAFRANATGLAGDTTDRIIYETDTGIIRYDSNGSTAGGTQVTFAQLQTPLPLDHTDFMVI